MYVLWGVCVDEEWPIWNLFL